MAKPYPPQEVTQAEQRISGFKHVSVFLAQASEQQATEQAKARADHAPPDAGADQDAQQ